MARQLVTPCECGGDWEGRGCERGGEGRERSEGCRAERACVVDSSLHS